MSDSLIAMLGLGLMAAWLIRSCWREYWKQEAFERGELLARAELTRDSALHICQQLTAELRTADELALKQARKSLEQQERIATIEARELPQLAEVRLLSGRVIRERRVSATGNVWGPS